MGTTRSMTPVTFTPERRPCNIIQMMHGNGCDMHIYVSKLKCQREGEASSSVVTVECWIRRSHELSCFLCFVVRPTIEIWILNKCVSKMQIPPYGAPQGQSSPKWEKLIPGSSRTSTRSFTPLSFSVAEKSVPYKQTHSKLSIPNILPYGGIITANRKCCRKTSIFHALSKLLLAAVVDARCSYGARYLVTDDSDCEFTTWWFESVTESLDRQGFQPASTGPRVLA